jgi:hypothetical protein
MSGRRQVRARSTKKSEEERVNVQTLQQRSKLTPEQIVMIKTCYDL